MKVLTDTGLGKLIALVKSHVSGAIDALKGDIFTGSKVKAAILPAASTTAIGAVKIGSGLAIDNAGTLSATGTEVGNASTSAFGVVKIGSGITVSSGVISVTHPSNISYFTNDKGYQTAAQVTATAKTEATAAVNAVVAGAPEALDTLKEVADAIEANDSVVSGLNAAIGAKADRSELPVAITDAEITALF